MNYLYGSYRSCVYFIFIPHEIGKRINYLLLNYLIFSIYKNTNSFQFLICKL